MVKVLTAQIQYDNIVAWCLIDEKKESKKYNFDCVGTGWPTSKDLGEYVNTVQDKYTGYVWHVFCEEVNDNEIIE